MMRPEFRQRAGALALSLGAMVLVPGLLSAAEAHSGDRSPSRREWWVPTRFLEEVLKRHPNAVLLDRAQYEALIRDAEKVKPGPGPALPPVEAVIEGARVHSELVSGALALRVTARLTVNSLTTGWARVPLLSWPAGVRPARLDGYLASLTPAREAAKEWMLGVRGEGRRQVTLEFEVPVSRSHGGVCRAPLPLPGRVCAMSLAVEPGMELAPPWMVRDGRATAPTPADHGGFMEVSWLEPPAGVAPVNLTQSGAVMATVDGLQATTIANLTIESPRSPLPGRLRFRLPDEGSHVVRIEEGNVVSWKQAGAILEVERARGIEPRLDLRIHLVRGSPDAGGTMPVVIDLPRLDGASRVSANVAVGVGAGFEWLGWETAPEAASEDLEAFRRSAREAGAGSAAAHFAVAPARIAAVVRRTGDRFSSDVDNRIVLGAHELSLDRSIALHGEEGRVNRTGLVLPAGERFQGLDLVGGERAEWKQTGPGDFEVTWPEGLRPGRSTTLRLRTWRDLPATSADAGGGRLTVENLRVPAAARVAGYLALDFDDSWKVTVAGAGGLEARDARATPVQGRMAWFTLRDHSLALDIARHQPVVDAGVLAYVLPRAKSLEIEGQLSLEVGRAPLRSFEVRLPPAVAPLLRVESPWIGGRSFNAATGVWQLSLRKELLGAANVRFRLTLPGEAQGGDQGGGAATTLTAVLPRIELPAARRFAGQWVIEANTETEITHSARGVQPLDALRAPEVEGYRPRHRVLAAFGYGAGPHEVRLTAIRHEPEALIGAVVEHLALTSVLGGDGSGRHEAVLRIKHNGRQFFGLNLPQGSTLLSAKVRGDAVKPVRAADGEVRVALPGRAGPGESVPVTVVYETRGRRWGSGGTHRLEPPDAGRDVPVLDALWTVHAPDGMEYSARGGFDDRQHQMTPIPTLLSRGLDLARSLRLAVVPRFAARGRPAPVLAELETAVAQQAPPKPGFVGRPAPAKPAALPPAQKMTRSTVPSVQFRGASPEKSGLSATMAGRPAAKSGLVALDIELPAAGRVLRFKGQQRPAPLVLGYVSWERQMARSALWAMLGILLFLAFGRRRPVLRSVAAGLLCTCVPVAFAPWSITAGNALLAGWFGGMLAWIVRGVAQWLEGRAARWPGRLAVLPFVIAAGPAGEGRAEDAEAPDPAAHTVMVPYDSALPPDPAQARRYYLDYADFRRLWDLAKENRRPPPPVDGEKGASPEAVIVSALYEAEVFEERLRLEARLQVMARGGKWVRLPLGFSAEGLATGEVRIDGRPAALREGALLVENPGAHLVEMSMELRRARGWKEAVVKIPGAGASLLAVAVPSSDGPPLIAAGGEILPDSREARAGRVIHTVVLGAAEELGLTRTPFRRPASDAPPAASENRATLTVLRHLEKVDATVSFGFAGVARDRFSVRLDAALKPVAWEIPGLRGWSLRQAGGHWFADLELTRPVPDRFDLRLRAERVVDAGGGIRRAPLVAGVAAAESTTIRVLHPDGLQVRPEVAGASRRVESGVPPVAGLVDGGSYRVPVGGHLGYSVSPAEDRSLSRVESVYQLGTDKAEIIAAVTLDGGRRVLEDARLGLPEGFEVQALTGSRVSSWHRSGGEVIVRFGGPPSREAKLVLHLARMTTAPSASWTLAPIRLAQFRKQEAVVLIAVHAADDARLEFDSASGRVREVDPASVRAVVTVAPPLAVKRAMTVAGADWSARVTLARQPSRFAVDAVLLAQATDAGLRLSQQVGIVMEQGAVNGVTVRLPAALPEARVRGPLVRDAPSRIAEGFREYDVRFQADVLSRADLSLDFELPLDGETTLPLVEVAGASRAQRFFIVDNASSRELETTARDAERTVRGLLPFVPAGLQRPAYFRAAERGAIRLAFRELESTAGNAAIVTLAEITTALRPSGERWERVVYSLANRSLQFLPVRLAAEAELIEVSVAGETVRADRADDGRFKAPGNARAGRTYLVPLIRMRPGDLSQEVRLVYRMPPLPDGLANRQAFDDPELVGLSAERTLWNVWVPERFAIRKWDGNVEEVAAELREIERQQGQVSDLARLNRVMSGTEAGSADWRLAYDNAGRIIRELRRSGGQRDGRTRSFPAAESDAAGDASRIGAEREELRKQIETQGSLLDSNSGRLEVAGGKIVADGKQGDPRREGAETNALWDAQASGQTIVSNANDAYTGLTSTGGAVVAFNDHVQVAQSFLQPPPEPATAAEVPARKGAAAAAPPAVNAYNGRANPLAARPPASTPAAGREEPLPAARGASPRKGGAAGVAFGDKLEKQDRSAAGLAPGAASAPEQQFKPAGRVSLAIEFPLEGSVHHFRKLKDHAAIEIRVVRPWSPARTRALWILAGATGALVIGAFARRRLGGGRRAVAL